MSRCKVIPVLPEADWDSIWAAFRLSKEDTPAGRAMRHRLEIYRQRDEEDQRDIAWAREHERIDELFKLKLSKRHLISAMRLNGGQVDEY